MSLLLRVLERKLHDEPAQVIGDWESDELRVEVISEMI